jgi:hypothetical protein
MFEIHFCHSHAHIALCCSYARPVSKKAPIVRAVISKRDRSASISDERQESHSPQLRHSNLKTSAWMQISYFRTAKPCLPPGFGQHWWSPTIYTSSCKRDMWQRTTSGARFAKSDTEASPSHCASSSTDSMNSAYCSAPLSLGLGLWCAPCCKAVVLF